jgi:hypothetical protein
MNKLRITTAGSIQFEHAKDKWTGPYSNEMLLIQELSDGQTRTLQELQKTFKQFINPSVDQIVKKFLSKGSIENVA